MSTVFKTISDENVVILATLFHLYGDKRCCLSRPDDILTGKNKGCQRIRWQKSADNEKKNKTAFSRYKCGSNGRKQTMTDIDQIFKQSNYVLAMPTVLMCVYVGGLDRFHGGFQQ